MQGKKQHGNHPVLRLLKKSTTYGTICSSKEGSILRASYAPMLSDQDQLIFDILVPANHYLRQVNLAFHYFLNLALTDALPHLLTGLVINVKRMVRLLLDQPPPRERCAMV